MRWIVFAAVALLSACKPSEPVQSTKPQVVQPAAPTPAPASAPVAPKVESAPVAPAPEVPEFYAQSPYKDNIAVANLNIGKAYAPFRQFLVTDGWTTTESTKCLENVKHPNAKVLCQTVPELLNCPSATTCNVLWVKKGGASVVISLDGNMVDIANTTPSSTLLIKKFTFFGITEKNQEVPDPFARFKEQMRPVEPVEPQPQAPIAPTPNP